MKEKNHPKLKRELPGKQIKILWLFSILVPLPPQGSAHTAFYIKYYCQDALEWSLQLPVGLQQKHS